MKLKLIFLDFDGCINSENFYRNRPAKDSRPYPLSEIDLVSVGYLNQICLQTGAKLVVSSTWRHGRTLAELQNILAECGFVGEIIGVTPSLSHQGNHIVRGNEILKWMQDNEKLLGVSQGGYDNDFEEYIILDDDLDMLYVHRDNFIHVDRSVGITSLTVSKALKILKVK